MTEKEKLDLIAEAIVDPSLSDAVFRMVAKTIVTPSEVTSRDLSWAKELLLEKQKGA